LVLALALAALANAGTIQKWQTPEGTLYFGDRPPAGSMKLGEIGEPDEDLPPAGDEPEGSEWSSGSPASLEDEGSSADASTSAEAPADDEVDEGLGSEEAASQFREALAPYGEWVQVVDYGYGWTPSGLPLGWRPYTDGHWEYTQYGATWVSDWEWGWAPFHYGRWTYDAFSRRWIWIPGRRWAPAWVAWRYGNGWAGWAPLPPRARWRRHGGIDPAAIALQPGDYCFVEQSRIIEPGLRHQIAPLSRGAELMSLTRDVTRYAIANRRVVNESLSRTDLERALGRSIAPRPVQEIRRAAPPVLAPAAPTSGARAQPGPQPPRARKGSTTGAALGTRPPTPHSPKEHGGRSGSRQAGSAAGQRAAHPPPARPPEVKSSREAQSAAPGGFGVPRSAGQSGEGHAPRTHGTGTTTR
jgi:hypothetical protein